MFWGVWKRPYQGGSDKLRNHQIRAGHVKFSLCPSPSFKKAPFSLTPILEPIFSLTSLFDFHVEEAYFDWKNIFKFRNPRQYFKGFTLLYFTISSETICSNSAIPIFQLLYSVFCSFSSVTFFSSPVKHGTFPVNFSNFQTVVTLALILREL